MAQVRMCVDIGLFLYVYAQEKLAVISSVFIGGMATIIPGYYYAVNSGSDSLV